MLDQLSKARTMPPLSAQKENLARLNPDCLGPL